MRNSIAISGLSLGMALAAVAHAQSQPAPPAFEVVSVKHSGNTTIVIEAGNGPAAIAIPTRGFRRSGGRLTCNLPLQSLIQEAYSLKDWQVVAPAWASSETYDLAALMPPETTRDEYRQMLGTMLAERFALKFHRESKELPIYALVVGKNAPTLHEVPYPGSYDTRSGRGEFSATAMPLTKFAEHLSHFAGRPVIDGTSIPGTFQIELKWTPDPEQDPRDAGHIIDKAMLSAVEAQMGLKLEARKLRTEILIVDHAERIPTPN